VCGGGGGGAQTPFLGSRREGSVVRLAQQLERFLGGGAAVLVRVHEQRQPPELLLDVDVCGGGGGAYAEDDAPFVIGASASGRRGEEDFICRECWRCWEGRVEPLGLAGQTVRTADVALPARQCEVKNTMARTLAHVGKVFDIMPLTVTLICGPY
jgi:hypothetical protein